MDLDEYTSPNAVSFRNQFRQLSGYINSFLKDVGSVELQTLHNTLNDTANILNDGIGAIERILRSNDGSILFYITFLMLYFLVRFHHWVPTGILPSSINHLVSRLEQNIMVLCELADALVIDPPATQNEALAIEVGQTVMKRVMFFQYVVLSIRPHRFSPVDSLEAFLIFQEQRDISFIIKQNFDLFTSSILHEIQNLILNAIDKIELTLDHKNVRCRDHVRLGTPILDYEPTFRKLLKRLQNSIYVLCVLIEAIDAKQRPKINEEEVNAITNGKKIIVELKEKINILILRSGGNKTLKIY